MTTVVDSNVIVALWDRDDNLNAAAQAALDAGLNRGRLVVPAPVFSELMLSPDEPSHSWMHSFRTPVCSSTGPSTNASG
jgi:predicted nucleic acid-binding protein